MIQELKGPTRRYPKRSAKHIVVELSKVKDKETQRQRQVPRYIKRKFDKHHSSQKKPSVGKKLPSSRSYPAKLSSRSEGEIKCFSDKKKNK